MSRNITATDLNVFLVTFSLSECSLLIEMILPWQLGPSSLVPFWRSGSDLAYNPCLICPGLNQSDTHPLTPSNIQIPKIVIFAKFDKIIGC